jgi:UvrB/uvrC motif
MNRDIDAVLKGWPYKPDVVQARLVQAGDGRQVIQMRVELGVLQMETTGRPDGTRPHGFPTYLDYLRQEVRDAGAGSFALDETQCQEADREFMQFYHRRVCWLALRNYARAVADADHTLAFMDVVRDHSPGDDYRIAHEQYRGFVLFHRTQAAAARAVEREQPEAAVKAIRDGLERLRQFFAAHELEEQMEDDGMVQQLRRMEQALRQTHALEPSLQEQLDEAVAKEDYERAARLRDQLRRQHPGGA